MFNTVLTWGVIVLYGLVLYLTFTILHYMACYRMMCKAVALVHKSTLDTDLCVEIHTASDLMLFLEIPREDAEKVVHGEFDCLLNHDCTLKYLG